MTRHPRQSLNEARVGFIVSHPFQFQTYRPLVRALPRSRVVIETRPDTPFAFSEAFLASLGCPHVSLPEHRLGRELDKAFDIVIGMTPKQLEHRFRHARTVAIQYGMAKEPYNYGLWRSGIDLNLMYGAYAHDIVSDHAVSRPVGNLRLDGHDAPGIGGGGLLYMPTYGENATLGRFVKLLPSLNPNVPIRVKVHHASEFTDAELLAELRRDPRVTILDGYHDALDDIAAADVVLSDYSGAMFDAFFLDRPVVLFQPKDLPVDTKSHLSSIEIDRGHDFGEVLSSDAALIRFFDRLERGMTFPRPAAERQTYLSNYGAALPAALEALDGLLGGDIRPTPAQLESRAYYRSLSDTDAGAGQASGPFQRVTDRVIRALRDRLGSGRS